MNVALRPRISTCTWSPASSMPWETSSKSVAGYPRLVKRMKEGCMAGRIRVRGVPRPEPDVRLYVLALIELARQLQAEESAKTSGESGGEKTSENAPEIGDD